MYRRGSQGWAKHLDFMVLDVISLQLSFYLAYILRNGMGNPYASPLYRSVAVVLVLVDIVLIIFFESLKNVLKRGRYQEFTKTLRHAFLLLVITSFYLFLVQAGENYSRLIMIWMGMIYLVVSYMLRLAFKAFLKSRGVGQTGRSLLIVTVSSTLDTVLTNIRENNYQSFRIAGIALLDAERVGETIQGIPVVADRDTVLSYVCREWVEEVFINIPPEEPYPRELIDQLSTAGIVVHIRMLKSSELIGKKQFVERLGNYTVLTVSLNYASLRQAFAKRVLDILGGIVGCIITGFLCLILAPLIYIQSPGPIFFSQIRVGKGGKRFKLYKFRSMYPDAEARKQELMEQNRVKDGRMFKLDWDPRIIGCRKLPDGSIKKGIGNFIRDWSLDEFPQFYNVLKGDMSLVGTRPPTVDEWEKYELHHRARLAIRPGITGMWQVSGRSRITSFEDVVRLDTTYISEWSFAMDLKILLKTFLVVLKREGAM